MIAIIRSAFRLILWKRIIFENFQHLYVGKVQIFQSVKNKSISDKRTIKRNEKDIILGS